MAWTNIFDLADWDVYIRYFGKTTFPDPNSRSFLVKAADLDPSVGTVTVEDGVIVCDLEDEGLGLQRPMLIAVPIGTPPVEAMARVSATTGGEPMFADTSESSAFSVASIDPEGPQIYSYTVGSVDDPVDAGTEVTNLLYSAPIPSGEGLGFLNMGPGI